MTENRSWFLKAYNSTWKGGKLTKKKINPKIRKTVLAKT